MVGLRRPQREVSLPVPRVRGPLSHCGLSRLVGTSVPCEVVSGFFTVRLFYISKGVCFITGVSRGHRPTRQVARTLG